MIVQLAAAATQPSNQAMERTADRCRVCAKSKALQRTADRREDSFLMTSTLKPEASLAHVSGRSAYSR